MLTVKQLKQCKIFEILLSGSRIYKKWLTSAIIREISDSNLETGRNSSKNLESPRLFERVDILLQCQPTIFFILTMTTKTVTAWGNDTTLSRSNWSFLDNLILCKLLVSNILVHLSFCLCQVSFRCTAMYGILKHKF